MTTLLEKFKEQSKFISQNEPEYEYIKIAKFVESSLIFRIYFPNDNNIYCNLRITPYLSCILYIKNQAKQ